MQHVLIVTLEIGHICVMSVSAILGVGGVMKLTIALKVSTMAQRMSTIVNTANGYMATLSNAYSYLTELDPYFEFVTVQDVCQVLLKSDVLYIFIETTIPWH